MSAGGWAALSAGMDLSSAIGHDMFSYYGQKKANEQNLQQSMLEAQWNNAMWHQNANYNREWWNEMNEYNSPKSQMRRLKEAGINPRLIYGSNAAGAAGTAPMGTARDSKGYTPPEMKSMTAGIQGFQGFSDFLINKERIDLMESQRRIADQEAVKRAYDTLGSALKNRKVAQDIGIRSQLHPYNLQIAEQNIEKTFQDIRKSTADADVAVSTRDSRIRKAEMELKKLDSDIKNIGSQISLRSDQKSMLRSQKHTERYRRNVMSQDAQLKFVERRLKEIEMNLRKHGVMNSDNIIWRLIMQGNEENLKEILMTPPKGGAGYPRH